MNLNMARPLRIEYPGACYHIINRGNQRMQVFYDKSHYSLFLEKLVNFAEQYHVLIRCYCLMPNHFHLYIETEDANLSRFMQSFLTSFVISLNRIRGKSGHVFQGRFKSQLVDDEAYGMALSRYIHLNPVKIKLMNNKNLKEKFNILDNFNWSSGKYYLGREAAPHWLDTDHILSKFNKSETENPYRYYLEDGILEEDNPFDSLKHQLFLGDEDFAERMKRKYILDLNIRSRKDQKNLAWLQGSFDFHEVVDIVADIYHLTPEDILKRKSKHSEARKFLIYCLWEYCRHSMSLSEMARNMELTQSGFSRSKGRFESMLTEERIRQNITHFRKAIKSITGV